MRQRIVFKSAMEFEEKVEEYFSACESESIYPDEAGMILFLGISRATYDKYLKGDGKYKAYADCLENARLRRESIIVRDIYTSETKSTTGKVFLAKQRNNGGLTDKPREDTREVTLDVKMKESCAEKFD